MSDLILCICRRQFLYRPGVTECPHCHRTVAFTYNHVERRGNPRATKRSYAGALPKPFKAGQISR